MKSPRPKLRELSLLLLIATATAPQRVAAHAAPYVLRIAWGDTENRVALVTNRGLIFGDPSRHQWRLMCNEALHINTSEQPDFAYLPDGRLMVAASTGLRTTADEGCTWQDVGPYGATSTPALAQDNASPATLYAGTYGPGLSAVRVSKDSGATWSVLRPAADNDFIQEILIAPSKRDRLYVSGESLDAGGVFTHYVARSDDGGATWEQHEYKVLDSEVDLTLLAISPTDPDLILAIAVAGSPMTMPDRVLVSADGGETFEDRGTFAAVLGGAFSADGSIVLVAGATGLLRSTDAAKTFAPVTGPNRMSCAFERHKMTFGCGLYETGQNGVGTSSDDGTSFVPWMAFTEVTEPVQCSPDTETASLCATLWRDWRGEIFGIWDAGTPVMMMDAATAPQMDAGTPRMDAGSMMQPASGGSAGHDEHPSSDDSGCSVHAARGRVGAGGNIALLLCWIALGWRRRRRA